MQTPGIVHQANDWRNEYSESTLQTNLRIQRTKP